MNTKQIYIHYGAKEFNPAINFPIKNRPYRWNKPYGGLWASRINSSFGWKDWVRRENFIKDCEINNSFMFVLSEVSNVKQISTLDQLFELPKINEDELCSGGLENIFCDIPEQSQFGHYIDFEKCLNSGIDAIELCWYGNEYKYIRHGDLHFALFGWDCDSIVILNPDILQIIDKEEVC